MNRPLHFFATFTTICTFVLLCSGGLVTSKGAGMAVPDWPTTYGYNMFLFPISRWVGGIFYEHTHRLMASVVGLLTLILCAWLLATEKRPWVRVLGIIAFLGVVLQGVLGGLRVTLNANFIGIFHGMVAQSFLGLLGILALVTSPWFLSEKYVAFCIPNKLKWIALTITAIIFAQLAVATSMRHAHAGLAIRDFPTAYGHWWPPMDAASIAQINRERIAEGEVATNATQIGLQMVHRLLAVIIFTGVFAFAYLSRKILYIRYFGFIWALLICLQIVLGAWTIWSDKAADVATSHMAIGALLLFLGVQMTFLLFWSSGAKALKTLRASHP
ncbi:MAG: cytochrome oxidase biogenesis protein CtaA [Verrucomicrobia bacterium]|nr:MAG: cytochrome oxidase biogenesis protein CtaA [Verrucomicrobiota bacterium]